ncbi:MAG: hypothetical protein M1536_04585 [Firmicutes bacterium]|nr:hypothetical protein [Bacillota bacterium]
MMETHLGLTPEEMISIFNRMYLDVWEKTRDRINWKEEDIPKLLLEVLEVVITSARDGAILTMYENNEKIYMDLKASGVKLQGVSVKEEEKAKE